ncbi:hypothetical protein MTBPR1_100187 [Candidatus Terasakiella magnetica]|uniref:Uncharacterized protein n=1 Tax=Candidatus Terasakiella magnetica TaxID=1867952 RepID=A0A1C3RE26_9PROT|nr:hypothetical protein [Candidatus Terasakiella magnetica]SCA55546.1 hypothetical protein MTBPR1_100187 [Candidatus Terasakiella magnetica]
MLSQEIFDQNCNYIESFYPGFMELQDLFDQYFVSKEIVSCEREQVRHLKKILQTAYEYCHFKSATMKGADGFEQTCGEKLKNQSQVLQHLKILKLSNFNLKIKELEAYVVNLMEGVVIPNEVHCVECPKNGLAMPLETAEPEQKKVASDELVGNELLEMDQKCISDIIHLLNNDPSLLADNAFLQTVMGEIEEFMEKYSAQSMDECGNSFMQELHDVLNVLESYQQGEENLVIHFRGCEINLAKRVFH